MKKALLFVYLVSFYLAGYAQATKMMTRDTLSLREKYEVLKSNHRIKQGRYTLIAYYSGKILTTGFYNNNKKDSVWREFDNKDHVIVEGHYKDGKKIGEWNYYGNNWVLTDTYDFDRHRLIYHKSTNADSTRMYQVINGTDTIGTVMDRPPVFLGGESIMYRTLMFNLRFPAEARAKRVSGRVLVAFTVDGQGHTRDYKVLQHLGYGCDEEALRVIKLIPDDWVPGVLNGKNVPVIIRIPVAFKTQ